MDFSVDNREASGGLIFNETLGGTTPSAARTAIANKMALFQREGGWIKRVTGGTAGGTVFTEVTSASFRATSIPGWQSRAGVDLDASFSLEYIPEFYENEVTDSDNSTTTARELIFTQTGLSGDNPARVRLVVDNDGSTDWRGLIWAYRSRHFPRDGSHQTTAKVTYGAEELQPLDTATKVALSGAHGGTVVTHGTLSTNWTPVVGTNIGGTSYLTHTGTYRVWARVYSTSGTAAQSRFVWDVGDLVNPAENPSFRVPGASNYYIMDYGEIRLDPSTVGTHRWQGQIQAKGDAGTENFSVDKLWFQNTDEGAGVLAAPVNLSEGLATYSARSEFNTESGTITGDSLAVGGTWTGAGDADDFTVTGGVATRVAVSDATVVGRHIVASSQTLTTTAVRVDFKHSVSGVATASGVLGRYTDTSNHFRAYYSAVIGRLVVVRVISASFGTLDSVPVSISPSSYYSLLLIIDSLGRYAVYLVPLGSNWGSPVVAGYEPQLATGGTLASGKVGIYDEQNSATANTRTYDNFAAWVPASDAVAYAGRSAQLGTEAVLRQDSGGTAYGPVSNVTGDLPRAPLGGTVETLLVPSTGDLDALPDTFGTASISARPYRRASWLYVDDT